MNGIIANEEDQISNISTECIMDNNRYILSLLDGLEEHIAIFDKDTILMYANNSYRVLLKKVYGIDLNIGDNYLNLLEKFPDEQKKIEGLMSICLGGEHVVVIERFGRPREELMYELSGYPVYGEDGDDTIGVSSIIRDVTERETLRMKADESVKSKEMFLSSVSHELRTPLNAILGFSQLAILDKDSINGTSYMNSILRSGRYLLELVNNVLDINSMNTDRFTVGMESINPYEVITDIYSDISVLADERKISLVVDMDTQYKGINVMADRQRYKQVIINYITNAIKYNRPHGSVFITLEIRENEGEKLMYTMVKDTGIGISQNNLKKIGEPFNRLGQETSNIEGTGLGLTISKKICHAMGGDCYVDSVLGEGSTFGIGLIVTDEKTHSEEVVINQIVGDDDFDGIIVYIEDNNFNLQLMEKIIKKYYPKCNYINEKDGVEGYQVIKELMPKLAILDINIPNKNGLDILKDIRADESMSGMKIIMLTADTTEKTRIVAKNHHADDYIVKPIIIGRLLGAINSSIR